MYFIDRHFVNWLCVVALLLDVMKLFVSRCVVGLMQGAPESVLDRCQYVRVGSGRVPMTASIKAEIMKEVRHYGTGR